MSEKEWIELGKMLDQAREHREDGLSSSAVPLYKDILKSDLLDAEEKSNVLAELGYAYYDLEEYKFASKSLKESLSLNENGAYYDDICILIGYCCYRIGEYEESITFYEKAINNTDDPEKRINLFYYIGRGYVFLYENKKAIKYLKRYMKEIITPDEDTVSMYKYYLGFAYLNSNKYYRAGKLFNQLIDTSVFEYEIKGYYGMTLLSFKKGKCSDVIRYGKEIFEKDQKFSKIEEVIFYMLKCFVIIDEKEKAKEYLNYFRKHYPNSTRLSELNELNSDGIHLTHGLNH
jgi:tetratricopeptide (TPR) repeat protein